MNDHAPEPLAVVVPREFASSKISTVEFASAVPVKVGVLSAVIVLFVGAVMLGADGAAVSTVSEIALESTLVFSAASVAFAAME